MASDIRISQGPMQTNGPATPAVQPALPNLNAQAAQPGVPLAQNVPLPALPADPPVVVPVPARPTLPARAQTTLAEIADTFRGQGSSKGTGLRLVTGADGQPRLEIKDPAKTTNPFTSRREQKHQDAVAFVRDVITREVGGDAALADEIMRKGGFGGGKLKLSQLDAIKSWVDSFKAVQALGRKHAAFTDGELHLRDQGNQHSVSRDGAGGVLFGKRIVDGRPEGVVVKIDRDVASSVCADYLSRLAGDAFRDAKSMAPFDMIEHELIAVPEGSPARRDLVDTLTPLTHSADTRTAAKAAEYLENLDEVTHVSKFELVDGTQLNRLDGDRRIGLLKSETFPNALGAAAVLMGPLGLTDHVGLAGCERFNLSNVMLGSDGRLKMMDLSTNHHQGRYGLAPQELTRYVDNLLGYLERAAGQSAERTLRDATKRDLTDYEPSDPFGKLLLGSLKEDQTDGLLEGTNAVSDGRVTAEDKKTYFARLIMGSIEGLEFLRDNIDAFADAHRNQPNLTKIVDSDATFGQIRDAIDGAKLDRLEAKLRAKLADFL